MPLTILVPLIVVGLAAVLLAVHFTGGSGPRRLTGEKARSIFQTNHPQDSIEQVFLSNQVDCAFLVLKDAGAIGFAKSMGRHVLTRRLDSKLVQDVSHADDKIIVKLADFTLPQIEFQADPETCKRVVQKFERMKEASRC